MDDFAYTVVEGGTWDQHILTCMYVIKNIIRHVTDKKISVLLASYSLQKEAIIIIMLSS